MKEPPRISVVIPTYRRRDAVRRALTALATQELPERAYEVVVAIDGSEDGTRELINAFQPPYALRSLWRPNHGRAAACNAGLREVRGEVIVFLDDDMEATPGFLAAHLQAHDGKSNLGVLGPVPIACDSTSSPYVRHTAARWEQKMARLAEPGHVFRLVDFYTGNFSIRRDCLARTGGFDESFRAYGHADRELFLRLREAGVAMTFCTAAVAHHNYVRSFSALARDSFARGWTAVQLVEKHPSLAEKHPSEVGDLALRHFDTGPMALRLVRGGLLALSERLPRIPDGIAALTEGWERLHRVPPPLFCYTRAIRYYYWLGVRAARRKESSARGPSCDSC
ncbi:MAG: glycosyltransferase [Acidobacteria bacterium]|nr:glycosyltransferase [Acidobacteriota bacterium]